MKITNIWLGCCMIILIILFVLCLCCIAIKYIDFDNINVDDEEINITKTRKEILKIMYK